MAQHQRDHRVLKVVGVVMMLVATSGVIGHNAAPRRFDYLAPRTARQDALRYERGVRIFRQRTVDEKVRSIFHQALVVGGLAVMIALVIDAVFA
jgi:hypothetical protein